MTRGARGRFGSRTTEATNMPLHSGRRGCGSGTEVPKHRTENGPAGRPSAGSGQAPTPLYPPEADLRQDGDGRRGAETPPYSGRSKLLPNGAVEGGCASPRGRGSHRTATAGSPGRAGFVASLLEDDKEGGGASAVQLPKRRERQHQRPPGLRSPATGPPSPVLARHPLPSSAPSQTRCTETRCTSERTEHHGMVATGVLPAQLLDRIRTALCRDAGGTQ